ncbi:MAG: DUF2934 domain-containing protein [Vicinamibacterales bacterium]
MAKKNKTSPPLSADSTPTASSNTFAPDPDAPSETATHEPAAASSSGDSRERIAARAYERYLERGGGPGHETEDWLEAEQEISGRAGRNGS